VRTLLRTVRRVGSALALTCFVVIGIGWFTLLRPANLGGPATYLVIRGSSMLPRYVTGDLVILRQEPAYRTGEIVGYRVPQGQIGAGSLVIHRIAGGDPIHGFVVRGDNNPAPDPWRPHPSDIAGTAWVMIPRVGQAIAAVRSPILLAGMCAAIVVTVVLLRAPTAGRRRIGARGEPVSS
jgi:signal peptidase I